MYQVKVIADSVSDAARVTSFQVTYPRFILAEVNTHRIIAKSTESSRAVPVRKRISAVLSDPFVPLAFGKNQSGMQARETLEGLKHTVSRWAWLGAAFTAAGWASILDRLGVHKQLANRIVEPYVWVTTVLTATEWDNFWALRTHPDAQPEFQTLACMMREAYDASKPHPKQLGEWHLPYIQRSEMLGPSASVIEWQDLARASAARCGRVSYRPHDGSDVDLAKDMARALGFNDGGHMCYDEDTEVLTHSGWVKWPDVTPSHDLFAVDFEARTGAFERPRGLHCSVLNGFMYHVGGQQLDLKVTLNHRMIVSRRLNTGAWTPYEAEEARDIVGKPRRYITSVEHASGAHADSVPTIVRDNTWFLRFLGFFIGDGHAVDGNQARFHLRKQRKIDFLIATGAPVTGMKSHKFVVSMPGLGSWLRAQCYDTSGEKRIPTWALHLTSSQRAELLEGLRNSDGGSKRHTWVYSSTSEQVISMLQTLIHMSGLSAGVSFSVYGPKSARYYRLNVSTRTAPRVETGNSGRSLTYAESIVPYCGKVYCATVSTGALLVRRNGHIVVSGNSPFDHPARAGMIDVRATKHCVQRLVGGSEDWTRNSPRMLDTNDFVAHLRGWTPLRRFIPYEYNFGLYKKAQEALKSQAERTAVNAAS